MAERSQFFRIAVEGGTTDGRVIDRAMIEDAAATFSTENYTPRIDCEHIRGFSPEPPFNAYGSVTGLKAEAIEQTLDGKTETKLALFGQIEPNDQLLAVNAKGQKIFTSCEFTPNFGGTGKWGLVALAITDNPASLGTEMLKFAAGQGDANPLSGRKKDKNNLFTAALEAPDLEFTASASPSSGGALDEVKGFFSALTAQLKGSPAPKQDSQPADTAQHSQDVGAGSDGNAPTTADPQFAALLEGIGKLAGVVEQQGNAFNSGLGRLQADFDKFKASVENTEAPGNPSRPAATGGSNQFAKTDC